MSRIGKLPVKIPAGVKVTCGTDAVSVEKGSTKLSVSLPPLTAAVVEDEQIKVSRANETRRAKAMHGLARSLVNNLVIGVSDGFKKDLEIIGVGYRAQIADDKLTLNLGYSHPVLFDVPNGVSVAVADNTKISISGPDKQLVGQTAATIRGFRKPEPYKGKGIRYVGEHIVMKEGKTVG